MFGFLGTPIGSEHGLVIDASAGRDEPLNE